MSRRRAALGALAIVALFAAGLSFAGRPAAGLDAGPLLADSVAELDRALADAGVAADVEAVEEGSFMLGAYPRSRVFWRIRLHAPATEDQLQRLADDALRLRTGTVWFSVPDDEGRRRLVTYSDQKDTQTMKERT
ncbi:MAG TPA: hypothetical protein VML96_06910 [Egibacteraceae bacterium]|nr:hypothetical protein [Egibacteraceae bacterium]